MQAYASLRFSGRNRLQWKFQCEGSAFADQTIHFDISLMRFDNALHIAQSQSKALDIMKIPGMGAIEFFEYAALGFLRHSNPIVFDTDNEVAGRAMGSNPDHQVVFRIFYGVVDQV